MVTKLLLIILLSLQVNKGDKLQNGVQSYLSSRFSEYESFEFEIISAPVNRRSNKVQIDTERDYKRSADLVYIPILISDKNSITQSIITLKVKLYSKVLIAKNTIQKNSHISKNEIEFTVSNIAAERGNVITDTTGIENYLAKFQIKQGDIILRERLEKIPLIKRGDQITAMVINGKVIVTLDATAREDGSEGEIINISTPGNKHFKAQVLDNLNVKILE